MVSQLADRAIDIRLATFHGYAHDQEMLLARQVRAADDTRTSSAGPPSASDLKRKATEHGVAGIWRDARESLDYSGRTYCTKAGITYLQRTTTLPDGVRVRGSYSVTIVKPGQIRVTFWQGGGGKRAATAVTAVVAAPSWSQWGSARAEVDGVTRRCAGRGGRSLPGAGTPERKVRI